MIAEYEIEPVRGLPAELPQGERIVWQGSPDWKRLTIDAFHVRIVGAYFAVLAGWAAAVGNLIGAAITIGLGLAAIAVLTLIAFAAARSSVYTLTDKRVVLRIGVALPKCINVPLTSVAAADLDAGHGNIVLRLSGEQRLGWIALWPHARPWHVDHVEPMLRALNDARKVAALLARAAGAQPVLATGGQPSQVELAVAA